MGPVIRIAREVVCYCCGLYCSSCHFTGNEYVVQEVRDVATAGNTYYGEHEWITGGHWFVDVSRLYLDNALVNLTYFRRLDENKTYFYFIEIYQWFDVCNASWEISIHPGLVIATIAMAHGISIPRAALILVTIPTILFGHEDSAPAFVRGQVLITEYAVDEHIYFRFNKYWYYQYKDGQLCAYAVPVLFYIESP